MKFVVILCLSFAIAVRSREVNRAVARSFEDNSRISGDAEQQQKISSRIVNGKEAARNQFPYQAGLLVYRKFDNSWCGGVLISNRWVLTAAHCMDGLGPGLVVCLGAWKRLDWSDSKQHILYVSRRNVIVHENYKSLTNDLSLVRLPVAIEFNEYVQPVNLPKKSGSYETYHGEIVIVSGWGNHGKQEAHDPAILRWMQAPVLPNEECATAYIPGLVKSTNICVDTRSGSEACFGDSGGPLILADGSRTLVGTLSFGAENGCEMNVPNVFARTMSYLDWIFEKTGLGKE